MIFFINILNPLKPKIQNGQTRFPNFTVNDLASDNIAVHDLASGNKP